MACKGYSKTSLMGNWYEERLAIRQPAREEQDFRTTREKEDAISYITTNNLLQPLERTNRAHPWNTSSVIVDDGYKEFRTLNKTTYDPTLLQNYKQYQDCRPLYKSVEPAKKYPEGYASIQTNKSKDFALISLNTMQKHVNEVQRDVKMNITDFGSTFKKHGPDHNQNYMLTTYQSSFDRAKKPTSQEVIQNDGILRKSFAGYQPRAEDSKGIKMTSALTSEVFKTEKDPQQNTRVQRAWLPYVENTIKVAEDNIKRNDELNASTGFKSNDKLANYKLNNTQKLGYDIATSLPFGEGAHTLMNKYMEAGAFRSIRTDVTLQRNKPYRR